MINYLYISIILVCFYDCLITLLLPSCTTVIIGTDGSTARMVCYLMAMAIGAYALLTSGLSKLTNKWLAYFMIFMIFSSFHGPAIRFEGMITPKDHGLYNFKPMFECIIYFLMFLGLMSLNITEEVRNKIFRSLAIVGMAYSVYVILQRFGADQIYKLTNEMLYNQMTRNPELGGFISQPVYAAAVIVICLPFVIREFKHWTLIPLVSLSLILNRSALVAVAFIGLYLLIGNRKVIHIMIVSYIAILALAVGICAVFPVFNTLVQPSGRLDAWTMIIKDFIHPHFPGIHISYILTGLGIGSFSILFPFFNHSSFFQAHNEILEVLYTLSFIGLFLFIKSGIHIFKTVKNEYIFMSLVGITICAMTNPVWHIPQLQFLTVFLIGLAYNQGVTSCGKQV